MMGDMPRDRPRSSSSSGGHYLDLKRDGFKFSGQSLFALAAALIMGAASAAFAFSGLLNRIETLEKTQDELIKRIKSLKDTTSEMNAAIRVLAAGQYTSATPAAKRAMAREANRTGMELVP